MEVFKLVINMSLVGSFMFIVFLLLETFTKKHFNGLYNYRILLILLIFFIFPFYKLVKFPEKFKLDPYKYEVEEKLAKSESVPNMVKEPIREDFTGEKTEKNIGITNSIGVEDELIDKDMGKTSKLDYGLIFFYIWLIGLISLATIRLKPYIRFKRFILKNGQEVVDFETIKTFNQTKAKLGIKRELSLKKVKSISSPMLVGLFSPVVLIEDIDKDYKKMEMIFSHELNHYKRKDILVKSLSFLLELIHWFNPIIYVLSKKLDKYCEQSIDEKVVEKMDLEDRKYYGEIILGIVENSLLENLSLTTSMKGSSKDLKERLESMIYSIRLTNKKRRVALLFGVLMLFSSFTMACGIIPENEAGGLASYMSYIKKDGLYYTDLKDKIEVKIQAGEGFNQPIISENGNYIAYKKDEDLYVYDLKEQNYRKLGESKNSYEDFYQWIGEELVYSIDKAGFTIYNPKTKDKKEHLDKHYYDNFRSNDSKHLYARQSDKWSKDGTDYSTSRGIVEIDLTKYDKKNKNFKNKLIIEGKKPTDDVLGYSPLISKVSADGRYLYIMEKFSSGSMSADFAGLGIYDTKEGVHKDFTDIYKNAEMDKGLVVLPKAYNLAINPNDSSLIAVINGGYRERYINKQTALVKVNEDKSYSFEALTKNNLVAMTPSFSLDGERLVYSATDAIDLNSVKDLENLYSNWENQAHNIYEYNIKTSKNRKLTDDKAFNFMPINIYKDEYLVSKYNKDNYGNVFIISNQGEELFLKDVYMDYFGDETMDLYLNKANKNYYVKEESKYSKNIDELYKYKGSYVGNNSSIGNIMTLSNFSDDIAYKHIQLQTKEKPYGINIDLDKSEASKYQRDFLELKSLILFALVDNLDYVQYTTEDETSIEGVQITRKDANQLTNKELKVSIENLSRDKKQFENLYKFVKEIN